MRIEYIALGALRRWPRNPKEHAHDQLEKSFGRFGFNQPLLVDERVNQLVAGHGRLETLQRLKAAGAEPPARVTVGEDGDWMVPVIRGVAFQDDHEAEAFLLADNRLSEVGGWDEAALSAMLQDLKAVDGLDGIGFSDTEIGHLLKTQDTQQGEDGVGPSVGNKLERYQNGEIKQVTLYFDGPQFDTVIARLQAVQAAESLQTNTDAVLFLLAKYEESRAAAGTKPS